MAGGFIGKTFPKGQKSNKLFSSELYQDSHFENSPSKPPQKTTLKGILGLGQSVDFGKKEQLIENKSKEIFHQISHLEREQNVLFDQRQRELQKTLTELRDEIGKLTKATDNLEKSVESVAIAEITEANDYQINFYTRIRNFISKIRREINSSDIWVQAFSAKKKKKNAFWGTVKNKKKGGEQYLFSNEHSSARSVN